MITLSHPDLLGLPPGREPPFIHAHAIVEPGAAVGSGTRVWAFAHVLPGATIGRDCNLCDHTFVEGNVVVGDRVTLKSGVYVWSGVHLEDDVFVGPAAVFTNDRTPRSRRYPDSFPTTVVRKGASIGANAVLCPGIEIGSYAMIGAGAVVTKDVPAHALVYGNPARVQGYVCKCGKKLAESESPPACSECRIHGDLPGRQAA